MILITRKKFSGEFQIKNMERDENNISKGFISMLPQLWQLLEDFPNSLKNGESWLISEEIIQYSPSLFSFDQLELFLLDEQTTVHSKKYIVNLNLQITKRSKLLAQINFTLLSKESWNGNI